MDAGETKFLRMKEVCERVGASKTTINGWIREGRFPKPCKLADISVWHSEDVTNWIQDVRQSAKEHPERKDHRPFCGQSSERDAQDLI